MSDYFSAYNTYTPTGFSDKIFKERYAFTEDETWEGSCSRVAKQVALAETPEKVRIYENNFNDILIKNLFVPGGRIWYQSGRCSPQMLNCFVLSSELDSREGWGSLAKEMIITSMTGGGCGIDFSDVRPNGAAINGQRGVCPGPVSLMELIDNCAEPVRSGNQRRVALLFSLDLTHPDILQFLDAKLEKGKLTHANISVRSKNTLDFIKAVKHDRDIELSWKGQYKSKINARFLWNKIVKNSYECAEPGFLNWELVQEESTVSYLYDLTSTNPCGEQPLPSYSNCCLGHLVLFRFVQNGEVDWASLSNTIRLAVRFLDNVLSVNYYPLEKMKEKALKERRIGLGTTGLADMLALLGYRYGSEDANKFVDKLYRFISKIAYESSVMLAIEKSPFPLCKPQEHIATGFVSRQTSKIKSLILEHGIRNCAILTVAPTGTVSIISNNCSSGIEPMFAPAYKRRFWKDDKREMELVFHPLFASFIAEGRDVSHFVGSHDLTVKEHMEVQRIVQKHTDSAVSKTINVPEDYPMSDISDLWLEYLPYLKGTTFYRENTRGFIEENGSISEPPLKALTLKESIEKYNSTSQIGSDLVLDCPKGVCSV